ncbi:MAG: hypothetical protein CMO55_05060 [Verrucomicrobiales bacterium]|nr:hypothetical protein [Verrucomicrobiales bacterium]
MSLRFNCAINRCKLWLKQVGLVKPGTVKHCEFPLGDIEKSVWNRFLSVARAYPEKPACDHSDGILTYAELSRYAALIAAQVSEADSMHNSPVGILMVAGEKELIPSILGVVKSSRPYVYLDPTLPDQRLRYISADSGFSVIVTTDSLAKIASNLATNVITVSVKEDCPHDLDVSENKPNPRAAFCINYTSGTTSNPVGVVRSQRALLANIRNMTNLSRIAPTDRLISLISPSFGAAAMDIFGALLNGACVVPYDLKREGIDTLPQFLEEKQVSFFHSVPTVFRSLVAATSDPLLLRYIRFILLGGEQVFASDFKLFQQWFRDDAQFQNVLGMTEGAGIVCSFIANKQTKLLNQQVPVGFPVEGKEVFIADEQGRRLELGERGEITVISQVISDGYTGESGNVERNTFVISADSRTLRTGDLGVLRPEDGALVWLGRNDNRTKVRGSRVSIAEVEAALLGRGEVEQAAVTAEGFEDSETFEVSTQLIGWIVPTPGSHPTSGGLRKVLTEILPADAIPARFVFLNSMPQLENGKIDRLLLNREHPAAQVQNSPLAILPRNDTERAVASAFSTALGIVEIRAYDHFFELGGDSLAAMNALGILTEKFGMELPATSLLSYSTPAALGEMIGVWSREASHNSKGVSSRIEFVPIVSLKTDGDKPPIFHCPGGHGTENEMLTFAKILHEANLERPIYGFRLADFLTEYENVSTFADLAERVSEKFFDLYPSGEWILLGECGSGQFAVELARQILERAPERAPSKLILVDSRTNDLMLVQKEGGREKKERLANERSFLSMLYHWQPNPIDFPIELIVSESFVTEEDDTLGWKDYCTQNISVHRVPGSHISYIREDSGNVSDILRQIVATERTGVAVDL